MKTERRTIPGIIKDGVVVPQSNTPLPNGIYVDILIRPVDMTPELKSEIDQWDKASDEAWALIDQEILPPKQSVPKFGSAKGLVKMSDDFDEPLEDFDGSPSY